MPIGVGIVDGSKSRSCRGRRMGEGIQSIATKHLIILGSSKSEEEAKDRLFNAGGVGFGYGVKTRSGAEGSIAAIARASLATGFDTVLPVGAKHGANAKFVDFVLVFELILGPKSMESRLLAESDA